jgi:hypothetical protein
LWVLSLAAKAHGGPYIIECTIIDSTIAMKISSGPP